MKRPKKKPSDYPLFYFRLKNEEEKTALDEAVSSTLETVNKKFSDEERAYTKGEVLRAALLEGLKLARRGKIKLPT